MERQSTRKLFKLVIALVALFTLALSVFAFGACGGEEHKHVYESSGKTAANCGTIGVETFTCSCGDTYVAVTPATGDHKWDASGKYCETCGLPNFGADGIDYSKIPDSFTAEDLDAIKAAITASKGELTTEQKAAHDALGEKVDGVQGSVDDLQGSVDDLQQAVSDLNTHPVHNLVAQTPIEIAGTCTSYGFTITLSECSTCHATFLTKIERSAALGHESDGGKVAVEPTCQLFGSWQETCTKCGAVLNERTLNTVPHEVDLTKLSDKSIPATCTEDGTDMYGCQWCGQVMPEYNRTAKALGHTYEAPDFVVPHVNDCTVDEQVTVTCERCEEGTEGHTAVLTALAGQHSFVQEGDLEIVDCTDAEHGAIKHEKCSVCGAVQDTNVPANGQHPAHDTASEIVIYIPLKPVDKWAEFKAKNNAQDPANLNKGSDGYKESNNVVKYTYYVCATCGLSVQVGAVAETHTFALDPESLLGTTHSAVNGVPQQECLDYTVTYRCTDTNCLAAYDSVVEGHGHNWSAPAWDENTGKGQVSAGWLVKADAEGKLLNATCTAEGVAYRYCTDCNAQHKTDAVDAKGVATYEEHAISKIDHQLTGWTDRLLPTCTEDGWVEGPCAFCGGTVRETLEATGHTYGEWKRVYGTNGDDECQSAHEARYCINGDCDDVQYREAASRYDHQWRLEVVTPNTCTKDGWGRDVCDRCGDAGTYHPIPASHAFTFDTTGLSDDQIKAILEKFVKPVWEKAYKPYATESFWTESIGPWLATAHNSNTITISMGVSATCERNGGIYHICLRCGLLEIENETPLANHVWKLDPAKQTVPATCTSTGTEYYVCSVCGETKTKTLEKLPHTWQLYLYDCTDSTNQSGYSGYYCTVCNAGYGKNNRADGLAKYYQGEGFITLEKGAELGLEAPVYHEGHAYRYANFTQGTLCGSDASYTIECGHCQMFQDDGGPLKNGTFTLTKDYFEANKKSEGWGEFLDFLFKTEGTEYEHRDGAVYRPDHTQATTPEAGKTVYTLKQFVPTAQWNAIEGVVNDGSNAHNVMVDEYYGCSVCGANSDVTKFHEVYTQKHNMTVLWKEELSDPSIPANVLNYKESACSYYDIDFGGGWYDSNIEGVETNSYAALNVHKNVNVVFYCTDDGCRGGIVSEHLYKWDGKHTFDAEDWNDEWTYEDAVENGWTIVEADKNITPDCLHSVRVERTCNHDRCDYTETETVYGAHKLGRWTYTEATCTRPRTRTAACTVCHKVVTEELGQPNGHTWKYDVDDKSTWDLVFDEEGRLEQQFPCRSTKVKNVCTVCGEEWIETIPPVTEHTWSTNIVTTGAGTKAPTCTEAGYGYVVCIYCGETRTVTIDALGHDWATDIWGAPLVNVVEPTCTEDGYRARYCKVCGYECKYGDEFYTVLPATGVHEWIQENGKNKMFVITEPTCTTDGTFAFECSVCHQQFIQTPYEDYNLKAKGHNWKEEEKVEATCTEGGRVYQVCQYCGLEQFVRVTPAKGHDTKFATGFKNEHGIIVWDNEDLEAYNELADAYVDCRDSIFTRYYCKVCGWTGEVTEIVPYPHEWKWREDWDELTYDEQLEAAANGDYYEKIILVKPTCESAGSYGYVCEQCGLVVYAGTIDPLGHWYYVGEDFARGADLTGIDPEVRRNHLNYVEVDINNSPCLAADYKVVECVDCGVRYAWGTGSAGEGHTWENIVKVADKEVCGTWTYTANLWYCTKCGLVVMTETNGKPDNRSVNYLNTSSDEFKALPEPQQNVLKQFADENGNILVKDETWDKTQGAVAAAAEGKYKATEIAALIKEAFKGEMTQHNFTDKGYNKLTVVEGNCNSAKITILLCLNCGITTEKNELPTDEQKVETKDGKEVKTTVYANIKKDSGEFFSYLLNKTYTDDEGEKRDSYEGFYDFGYVNNTVYGRQLYADADDKTDAKPTLNLGATPDNSVAYDFLNTWRLNYPAIQAKLGLNEGDLALPTNAQDWQKAGWPAAIYDSSTQATDPDTWLNVYYYYNFAGVVIGENDHDFISKHEGVTDYAACQMDPFLTILFEDLIGDSVRKDAEILRPDHFDGEQTYIQNATKIRGVVKSAYYTEDAQTKVKKWKTISELTPEGGTWTDAAKATDWYKTTTTFEKYEPVIDLLAAMTEAEINDFYTNVISKTITGSEFGGWTNYKGINDFCLNQCTIKGEKDTYNGFVFTKPHDMAWRIYKVDPVTGKKTGEVYTEWAFKNEPEWTVPEDLTKAPEGWDKTLQFIQYLYNNKADAEVQKKFAKYYAPISENGYGEAIEYVIYERETTCLVCEACKYCDLKIDNERHVFPKDSSDLANWKNCQHGDLCVACQKELNDPAKHNLQDAAKFVGDFKEMYDLLVSDDYYPELALKDGLCYEAGQKVEICVGCLEAWYNDTMNGTSNWKKPNVTSSKPTELENAGWVKGVNYTIEEIVVDHIFKVSDHWQELAKHMGMGDAEAADLEAKAPVTQSDVEEKILSFFGDIKDGVVKVGNATLSFNNNYLTLDYEADKTNEGACKGASYRQRLCLFCAIDNEGFGEVAVDKLGTFVNVGTEEAPKWKLENNYGVQSAKSGEETKSVTAPADGTKPEEITDKDMGRRNVWAQLVHVYAPDENLNEHTGEDGYVWINVSCLRCGDKAVASINSLVSGDESQSHIYVPTEEKFNTLKSSKKAENGLKVPDAPNFVWDGHTDKEYTVGGATELANAQGTLESGYFTLAAGDEDEGVVELESALTVSGDVIFNIAEGTTVKLDTDGASSVVSGTLTIKGGTLELPKVNDESGARLEADGEGSKVTLEGVTVNSDAPLYAANGGTIELIDTFLHSNASYGLSSNNTTSPCTFVIKNSTIASMDQTNGQGTGNGGNVGLLINNDKNVVTAENSTFYGVVKGAWIRSGKATFTNCTFISGSAFIGDDSWSTGTKSAKKATAALIVGNGGGPAYGSADVTLTNCTSIVSLEKVKNEGGKYVADTGNLVTIAENAENGAKISAQEYKPTAEQQAKAPAAQKITLAVLNDSGVKLTLDATSATNFGVTKTSMIEDTNVFTEGTPGALTQITITIGEDAAFNPVAAQKP